MVYEDINNKDTNELSKIFMNAFNSPPWSEEWTIETSSERLSMMINGNNYYGMVSRDHKDGDIIAFIIGHYESFYTGMQFIIDDFCTDVSKHGKGYGKALLDEFSDKLKEKGVKKIILNTLNTDRTEGFYNNRGYVTFNNMIVMGKDLI